MKDTTVLAEGVPREVVISEFGAPVSTDKEDVIRTDIFTFHKGSDTNWKVGRAIFHTAADVVTLGLWEIVGTPTEVLVKGDRITATVVYDKKDREKSWRIIGDKAKPQPVLTDGNSEKDADS